MFYELEEGLLCVVATLAIAAVAFAICAATLLVREAVMHGIRGLQRASAGVLRFIVGHMPDSHRGSGKTLPAVVRSAVLSENVLKFRGHRVQL